MMPRTFFFGFACGCVGEVCLEPPRQPKRVRRWFRSYEDPGHDCPRPLLTHCALHRGAGAMRNALRWIETNPGADPAETTERVRYALAEAGDESLARS